MLYNLLKTVAQVRLYASPTCINIQCFFGSYPKLAIVVFGVHYELETAINLKGEHVVAFLLFSYKRLCTVAFGYVVRIGLVW